MSPAASLPFNRSGVTHPEAYEAPPEPKPDPFGQLEAVLEDVARVRPLLERLLQDSRSRSRVRNNSHQLLPIDTAATMPASRDQGVPFDVVTIFGAPASKLEVLSVGGAGTTMQLNVNGEGWFPAAANMPPLTDETIFTLAVRVTTPNVGTALIRLGAYIGKE